MKKGSQHKEPIAGVYKKEEQIDKENSAKLNRIRLLTAFAISAIFIIVFKPRIILIVSNSGLMNNSIMID